jgi:mannitol-1-phosphate 5-dehydrogenase
LNFRKSYNVIIRSEREEIINITNVRGVYGNDTSAVVFEVVTAGLVAISVGLHGLSSIIPLLAKGLERRFTIDQHSALDIIIAENMRNGDAFFREELGKIMPKDYPLNQLVGLVETSIGKMVPIMHKKDMDEDILQVLAEPYNTLILDKKAFKNPIPQIQSIAPKENMKAWVDRKLFIHNLGHAATAYIGYLNNSEFV